MSQIHLQGIGKHAAIPAKDLRSGMVTIWNYGVKETVKSIEPSKTGKTLKAVIITESGKEFTKKLAATRLVAVQ